MMAALIVLWEAAVRLFDIQDWLLPAPSSVFEQLVARGPDMTSDVWYTLRVTLIGFGVSVVLGIVIAVVISLSPLLHNSIMPLLVVSQAIPKVALAPLLLVWVGYGAPTSITVAFLVSFFPMVVSTATGLRAVEAELIDLSRSLSASRWQAFRKVIFPSSLPYVFSGAKVSVTLALIGAVIGEFVGSEVGLGNEVLLASSQLLTSVAFTAIFLLSLMGIGLFYAVEAAERFFCPWASRVDG
jgi:NitT/TauT family transport system permease protein